MDIKAIRQKYKMIVNCEEIINQQENQDRQQQSEREWTKIVKNHQKKRVLTEANHNPRDFKDIKDISIKKIKEKQKNSAFSTKKPTHTSNYESNILMLKQKLAQSIHDSKKKDQQIIQLQNIIIQKNQQIKHLNHTIQSTKKQIQTKDNLLTEQKIRFSLSEKKIEEKNNQIKSYQVDNELLQSQIQHYRKKIEDMNEKFREKQKQYDSVHKELKKNSELKSKVQRLEDDVKRLQFLLSDNQVYAPLFVSLEGKHFLGKSNKQGKELEYWYPESLIEGVERFLKRQKVGFGNKQFTQNVIKFIYGLLERNQKKCQKKCKTIYNSRIKEIQRKRNHIFNITEVATLAQEQSKKLSQFNSRLCSSMMRKTTPLTMRNQSGQKSKGFSICMNRHNLDRSRASQFKNNYSTVLPLSAKKSFFIEGLQKSIRLNTEKKKDLIFEIVDSFCEGISKIFLSFNDKKKNGLQKIKQLFEWFKQSIQEALFIQNNKLEKKANKTEQRQYNSTGKWKTIGDL